MLGIECRHCDERSVAMDRRSMPIGKKMLPAALLAVLLAAMLCLGVGCAGQREDTNSQDTRDEAAEQRDNAQESTDGSPSADDPAVWPENENTAGVPAPPFDEQPTVLDTEELTSLTYLDVDEEEARAYLDELKQAGFTQVESDSDVLGSISYVARNPETGVHLSFSYTASTGSTTISLDRYGA